MESYLKYDGGDSLQFAFQPRSQTFHLSLSVSHPSPKPPVDARCAGWLRRSGMNVGFFGSPYFVREYNPREQGQGRKGMKQRREPTQGASY